MYKQDVKFPTGLTLSAQFGPILSHFPKPIPKIGFFTHLGHIFGQIKYLFPRLVPYVKKKLLPTFSSLSYFSVLYFFFLKIFSRNLKSAMGWFNQKYLIIFMKNTENLPKNLLIRPGKYRKNILAFRYEIPKIWVHKF